MESILECLTRHGIKINNGKIPKIEDIQCIVFSTGPPKYKLECRECRGMLDANLFTFYKQRIDKYNNLMRSNAICINCKDMINFNRKRVLTKDAEIIPFKPQNGSMCNGCNRQWGTIDKPQNFHRHHVGENFVEWLCGNCNMSKNDQRNNIKQ